MIIGTIYCNRGFSRHDAECGADSETAAGRGRRTFAYFMTIVDACLVTSNAVNTITHHSRAKMCEEETSKTPWPTICGHDHADENDAAAGSDDGAESSLANNINNEHGAQLQVHKGKWCTRCLRCIYD